MSQCPCCARRWRDLDRHLRFAHGETVLLRIENTIASPLPVIEGIRLIPAASEWTPVTPLEKAVEARDADEVIRLLNAEPVWLPAAFALLSLAGLWLVVAS